MKASIHSRYDDDASSDGSFDWSSDSSPKTKRKITKKRNHQFQINDLISYIKAFTKLDFIFIMCFQPKQPMLRLKKQQVSQCLKKRSCSIRFFD